MNRDLSIEELAETSRRRATKHLIDAISAVLQPLVWESGYRAAGGEMLKLYAPTQPKKFRGLVVEEVVAIGQGWYADDATGGGLTVIDFESTPVCDLLLLYEWVRVLKPRPVA